MTKDELRKDPEYIKAVNKINSYPVGYKFKVPFYKMTTGQKNGMNIILRDCQDNGLIKSVAMYLDLQGNITEEEYERR